MKLLIISHTIRKDKYNLYGWVHRGIRVLPSLGVDVRYVFQDEWLGLTKIFHEFKPDIILTLGPFSAYVLHLSKIAKYGVPIGHDWHDDYVKTMGVRWTPVLMKKLTKYILSHSYFVTTPSLNRYNYLSSIHEHPFHWMHGAKQHKRKPKKTNTKWPTIAYFGEISKKKRVHDLVNAAIGKPVTIYLYGEPDKSFFDSLYIAQTNVRYMDPVPLEKLHDEMLKYDFLALTEDNDSSIKMSHYFAVKKPIIGLHGELDAYDEYIYLHDNFTIALNEVIKFHLKKKLNPKKIYPIKSEEYYMKQYIKFLKKIKKEYDEKN